MRLRIAQSVGTLRNAFAHPPLRRVELAFAGSAIGLYANSIAVAVYAYHHGGATALGAFMFVRLGVAATTAPLVAALADRYPNQRVMLVSDLLRVCSAGGCALVAAFHAPALALYVLATATSVFGAAFRPAESALLPRLARTPEELTAANVASSTFDSVGSFVGPAAGALLLAVGGTAPVFVAVALTFLWSASFVARVHTSDELGGSEPEEEAEEHRGLAGGLRAVRAEPRLRLLIGLYAAQALVAGALGVLVIVIALQILDIGNSGVGLLEAASGIGSVVGAAVALALVGRKRLAGDFGLGIVLWGAPLVLIGVVPATWLAIVALGVVGVGNTLVDIAGLTLLQRTAPPAVAARVFGLVESALVGALALGALLAPLLVHLVGARGALIATGAFLPALAALGATRLRAIDAAARLPEEQLAALRAVPFLAVLPVQQIEALALSAVPLELAAGATLFRRGEPGDRFYVLDRGAIEIDLDQGAKVLSAPAYAGEIALLRDTGRTATVQVVADAHFWAIERSAFLTAVSGHTRSRSVANEVVAARTGPVPAA